MTTLTPERIYCNTLSIMGTQTTSEPWIPDVSDSFKPTLVIGDVHGHFDRLEALLKQEGIINTCPDCDGFGTLPTGEINGGDATVVECSDCHGDGQRRTNFDVEVVQLGDLGHFGQDASPTGDVMCYQYADRWLDVLLWGNHDRAVVDSHHAFNGYLTPLPEVKHMMHLLYAKDKLRLAHMAHGYLITHAGLQAGWKQQAGIEFDRTDPEVVADWINNSDWWPSGDSGRQVPVTYPSPPDHLTDTERSAMAVRDAISFKRGGNSPTGGILWRDEEEKLYEGFPQLYGHSAQRDGEFVIHKYEGKHPRTRIKGKSGIWKGDAFNLDIGSKYEAHLGAIWLPERRLVRVDI